jgi:broad specificity phosphatase PhoE
MLTVMCILLFTTSSNCLIATERYIILRHGETNFNRDAVIQGSSDVSRLTAQGVSQASAAGNALATLDELRFTRVFVSPLTRATETLAQVRLAYPEPMQLPEATILSTLREVDLYSWEGRPKAELQRAYAGAYQAWQEAPLDFEVDGHRPIVELWDRAEEAWSLMREDDGAHRDGVTLVVCHNGIGQALALSALGLDASYFRRLSFPNCGALELEWPLNEPTGMRWRWRLPLESTNENDVDSAASPATQWRMGPELSPSDAKYGGV